MTDKERELTKEELKYIFDFCKKWDVEYVDLRLELVDHMASKITVLWKENPNLTFKEAFHQVYKSFGIFGLLNVVEEHRKIVYKKYMTELKNGFKEWLTPPRVLATLLMMSIFYLLFDLAPFILAPAFVTLMLGLIVAGLWLVLWSKKLSKYINGEETMLLSTPKWFVWIIYFIVMVPFNTFNRAIFYGEIDLAFLHNPTGAFVASLITTFSILYVAVNVKIVQMAKEQLADMKKQMALFV